MRIELAKEPARNESPCNSGPQSPSLAVAPLPPSTRPPGAGLPEFRATLLFCSFPIAVCMFVYAVLFIFVPVSN